MYFLLSFLQLCEIKDTAIICGRQTRRRKRSVDGVEEELKSVDLAFNVTAFQKYSTVTDCDKICRMTRLPANRCTPELCVSVRIRKSIRKLITSGGFKGKFSELKTRLSTSLTEKFWLC